MVVLRVCTECAPCLLIVRRDLFVKPSLAERYVHATGSSDLRVYAARPSDVDKLIAAALVCVEHPRRNVAMMVLRLRQSGDLRGAYGVAQALATMVRSHDFRLRKGGRDVISMRDASEMCLAMLKWWSCPACPVCAGRGHPVIGGTPMLDESQCCLACAGTGVVHLEQVVGRERVALAQWLAGEMSALSGAAMSAMRQRLVSEGV